MHGLGNDFVVIDGREEPVAMTPALAKALADRHLGIGCDQLILLESCGNASRCVVALTGARSVETGGGVLEGATFGAEVEVTLPPPRFAWDEIPWAELAFPSVTWALRHWREVEGRPSFAAFGNPNAEFGERKPAGL